MTLHRRPDWPERLAECINQHRSTPFAYGQFDCCIFAAEVVGEMTGVDFMVGFEYHDERGALRILQEVGSLEHLLSQFFEPIHPAWARQGDLVLAKDRKGRDGIGVCDGLFYVMPTRTGLALRPMAEVSKAWRV